MRVARKMGVLATVLVIGWVKVAWADFQTAYDAYLAKDYSKALQEFTPVAEAGNATAQAFLRLLYERGLGTPKDIHEAIKWHRMAADQGLALSQGRLGTIYATGAGVATDYKTGLKWIRKAADQGHARSQHHLSIMYHKGQGVVRNRKEAVKWSRKAAMHGLATSQYNLGLAYFEGHGIAPDDQKAAEWFARAAAQGHSKAQFRLGQMYEAGIAVAKDEEKAIEWYRKAAAQGMKSAAVTLEDLLARRDRYDRIAESKLAARSIDRPNDFAVVIGNGNYQKFGKDIPDVVPAQADAAAFRKWLVDAKGLREGNIIFLKDATSAQIEAAFGNERSHKGQLFNWTKPNISNIYVYYAGHGAPASDGGSAFLVPVDASASSIELTGYPLATLYENLKKIPAKSITLVLESCFSGASQGGYVINRTSGILVTPKLPRAPRNITIISAGKADQVASWEQDDSHSLFTKYFLLGMAGAADKSPHGNGDGKVAYGELGRYLDGTMTYYARRYYGRDQNAQIVTTSR